MIGKRLLPRSLFGRALLILLLPTVLIQLVMAYVFFDRHWDNVTRYMSGALAGEIAFIVNQVNTMPGAYLPGLLENFEESTNIHVMFEDMENYKPQRTPPELAEFRDQLKKIIAEPFTVRKIEKGSIIEVSILLDEEVLRLRTTVKRLESRTTIIYLLWMTGASVIFLLIAVIFLRNQIRPIRKLAEAADNFGRGVDMPGFRPHGATEVRKAARAFIVMRERIKRQLRTRTEMLAGISHDLRTPLTRMKLQLAMLDHSATAELRDDVQQMEHMIQEYLEFARGEGREEAIKANLRELLEEVVNDYRRLDAAVVFDGCEDIILDVRLIGFKRMLHNLIDNALRYGKRCVVSVRRMTNYCEILLDDEGPGIPQDKRDEVFKPFNRLDPSRNIKTGGVGLGLTIARDIILAHGGSIILDNSPQHGLRVIIRLPL